MKTGNKNQILYNIYKSVQMIINKLMTLNYVNIVLYRVMVQMYFINNVIIFIQITIKRKGCSDKVFYLIILQVSLKLTMCKVKQAAWRMDLRNENQ